MSEGKAENRVLELESEFDDWAKRFEAFYARGSRNEVEFRFTRKMVLAARRWTSFIDEVIRNASGHPRARWQTLFAVAFSEGPVATLDLSERLGVQWPTLIRTLNELEKEGLIERRINPEDRRSRLITISEEGLEVIRKVQTVLDPTRRKILESFTTEELIITGRVLDRLFTILVEAEENARHGLRY
jgi:MarR family transcriptional regulator for hemolysin